MQHSLAPTWRGLRIISEETKAKDVFTINRRVGNAERSLDHSVT